MYFLNNTFGHARQDGVSSEDKVLAGRYLQQLKVALLRQETSHLWNKH